MADDKQKQNPWEMDWHPAPSQGAAAATAPTKDSQKPWERDWTPPATQTQAGPDVNPETSPQRFNPIPSSVPIVGRPESIPHAPALETAGHIVSEGGKALKGLGSGLYSTAKDVLDPTVPLVEGQDSLLNKYVVSPFKQEQAKAQTALNRDPSHPVMNQMESFGHGLASVLPIIGPYASSMGEQAGTGDIEGTAANVGTTLAAPKVAGKTLSVASKIPSGVSNVYGGIKYLSDLGNKMKTAGVEGGADTPFRPGALDEAAKAARARQAPPITAAPTVKDLANQVVDQNIKPTPKPAPGQPIYARPKPSLPTPVITAPPQAEIPSATENLAPTVPEAPVSQPPITAAPEINAPERPGTPANEVPKRTSAHHVYGDEVGDELRDNPDLQKYFNGKRGEGFTNVKARQALIHAGEDMGQQVVNSKMLQGEGAITPGQAVNILRGKGYTMDQIRELAERPAKKE